MSTMLQASLNNGVDMPLLGFGVFQIPPEETERAVSQALEIGYRSIDTAAAYQNEEAVGRAIATSGVPRDELFITTKLWLHDAGEARAQRAFDTCMSKLGLDRLDLCLIHQPYGDYYGTWRVLEREYQQGAVRALGVSNFHPDRVADLIAHNEVIPAVDQIECHPYFQQGEAQQQLLARGVRMEAWGPLAQGQHDLLRDPLLLRLADARGKSVPQVVLRWLIQREVVVVVKSSSTDRMSENLAVFDFELSADEMASIASLDGTAGTAFDHRDPANVDFIHTLRLTS